MLSRLTDTLYLRLVNKQIIIITTAKRRIGEMIWPNKQETHIIRYPIEANKAPHQGFLKAQYIKVRSVAFPIIPMIKKTNNTPG